MNQAGTHFCVTHRHMLIPLGSVFFKFSADHNNFSLDNFFNISRLSSLQLFLDMIKARSFGKFALRSKATIRLNSTLPFDGSPKNEKVPKLPEGGIRLKIDPKTATTFEDLKIPPSLINAVKKAYPYIKEPTSTQKNMLSLLQSDLSLLVKAESGSGMSTATILYLLAVKPLKVNTGENDSCIQNLVVVPTQDLALQYEETIKNILQNSPIDIKNAIQILYRTSEDEQNRQINILKDYPAPKILVGTPTRILDILANSDMRQYLRLNALSTIVLDEVEQLIPKNEKLESNLKQTSKYSKKVARAPTEILLDHIIPLRNYNIEQYNDIFVPLRLIFQSCVASSYTKKLAVQHRWATTRPMLRLGLTGLPNTINNTIPSNVKSHLVTYDQTINLLRDTKFELIDPDLLADPEFLMSTQGLNELRRKQLLWEQSKTTSNSILETVTDYITGLVKLFKEANIDTTEPILILVPERFSIPTFIEKLHDIGNIKASASKYDKNMESQVYVYRAKNVAGLDFPNLKNVFILGWDTLLSSKLFVVAAGRCRPKEGDDGHVYLLSLANEENKEHSFSLGVSLAKISCIPEKTF